MLSVSRFPRRSVRRVYLPRLAGHRFSERNAQYPRPSGDRVINQSRLDRLEKSSESARQMQEADQIPRVASRAFRREVSGGYYPPVGGSPSSHQRFLS